VPAGAKFPLLFPHVNRHPTAYNHPPSVLGKPVPSLQYWASTCAAHPERFPRGVEPAQVLVGKYASAEDVTEAGEETCAICQEEMNNPVVRRPHA
jgi:hypothetical protein